MEEGENMKYDPGVPHLRRELAFELLAKMGEAGFAHEKIEGTHEAVFSRSIPEKPGVRLLVYTSVVPGVQGPEVREVGADAIRVCAVYRTKEGRDKGLLRAESRVHRVGQVLDIVSRTHGRMREVWALAKSCETCSCGAPFFLSKKGNKVCADLCWKK